MERVRLYQQKILMERINDSRMPITERHKRKRGINLALAAVLLGLALLFFAITLVKFGGGS